MLLKHKRLPKSPHPTVVSTADKMYLCEQWHRCECRASIDYQLGLLASGNFSKHCLNLESVISCWRETKKISYLGDLHRVSLLLLPLSLISKRKLHCSQRSGDGAAEEHSSTVRHGYLSKHHSAGVNRAQYLRHNIT